MKGFKVEYYIFLSPSLLDAIDATDCRQKTAKRATDRVNTADEMSRRGVKLDRLSSEFLTNLRPASFLALGLVESSSFML